MTEGKTSLEIEAAEALSLLSRGGHMGSVPATQQQKTTNLDSKPHVNNRFSPETTPRERESSSPPPSSPTLSQVLAVPAAAIHQTPLQAYLIHQQRLAGIAPDKIIMIQESRNGQQQSRTLPGRPQNRQPPPPIVQITDNGIVVPHIPPARFNGVVPQLPTVTTQSAGDFTESRPQTQEGDNITHGEESDLEIMQYGRRTTSILRPRITEVGGIRASTRRVSRESNAFQLSHPSVTKSLTRAPEQGQRRVPGGSPTAMSPAIRSRPTRRQKTDRELDERYINKNFNIFHAIMRHSELAFILAKHLRVRDLISLYAISRDFHKLMNTRFTAMILSQATEKAPESARVFPFRCYHSLCIEDPAQNPHPDLARASSGENRHVPSFRWLLMVCWRETVVSDIMRMMEEEGVGMPKECTLTIKKLWFLMDVPDNVRRIGIIQNERLWTYLDLLFATLFFVKLDMRFTDPLSGGGRDGMRRLILAQPSFMLLWKLLRRTALQTHFDTLKAYIRWKYRPMPHEANIHIFGVPPEEVGSLQFEGYGKTGSRVRLQRTDELILKESIRRKLNMQERYIDMFLWGYVNPNRVGFEKETRPLQNTEMRDQSNTTN